MVALEVVRVDAAIIGDHAPYHLPIASPSESSCSVPVNTSSINQNPSLDGSTIPLLALEFFIVDPTIIGDSAPYHLHVPSP